MITELSGWIRPRIHNLALLGIICLPWDAHATTAPIELKTMGGALKTVASTNPTDSLTARCEQEFTKMCGTPELSRQIIRSSHKAVTAIGLLASTSAESAMGYQ